MQYGVTQEENWEGGKEGWLFFPFSPALGKKGRKPKRGRGAQTNRGEMDGGGRDRSESAAYW